MRVTTKMSVGTLTSNLNRSQARMADLQTQLSSGSRLNRLADDPAAVDRSLGLRGELRNIEQYQKNIDDGTGWLELSESTLNELETVFVTARGLAVQGASDNYNEEQRRSLADQVDQYLEHAVSLSEARYRGRYIFGGTNTGRPPYLARRDGTGRALAVQAAGDSSGSIEREVVAGVTVQVNVPGSALFEGEINAFSALIALRDGLRRNDVAAVRGSLTTLDDVRENISNVRGQIGARVNRMEITRNLLDRMSTDMKSSLSEEEDVDVTAAVLQLQQQQDVFQAALASANMAVPESLMDFIR
jgi:flagellar hook-associated protein 3 FlgL